MLVLDSDILIDVQRGHPPAVAWFAQLAEIPVVPGLVAMELVQNARNQREIEAAIKLVAPFPIVWPSSDVALAPCKCFRRSISPVV